MALDPSKHPSYAAECGDPSRTKKLGFGRRPAILLLDICEAYLSRSSPLCLPEQTRDLAIEALSALLDAARQEGSSSSAAEAQNIPIIWAQTLYTHKGIRDAGLIASKAPSYAKHFHVHSEQNLTGLPKGARYVSIQPSGDDIMLKKKYPSPFFGTNLSTQLASLGVDTLIIAGFTTSGNVRAATLDAMQSGFRPIVVAEACGDRGQETHWANLMDLGAKYGDVVSVADAVEAIKRGWNP